jgi:quinoprotein glucose dehydrogenase
LSALNGERLWHFQIVHHDLWDYDPAAMPSLFEIERNGETIPAVAVVGKHGQTFTFNRVSGEPLFPIEERPVPASDVPGEVASPTQPFPTKPPAFSRNSMSRDDLHSTDPDKLAELQTFYDTLRAEGPFTPPSARGSVVIPGQLGGANWSGAAIAPGGMMYITANELPYVTSIKPSDGPFGYTPSARHFLDSKGKPAIKPPWGTLTKIDLAKGELVWQKPLGNFAELNLGNIPTGTMNFGGGTVTAGGLFFVAAALDAKLRAFDVESGEVLAEFPLEVPGQGAPVTWLGADGRQYVAVFAGGGGKAGSPSGDYVIAFRLN